MDDPCLYHLRSDHLAKDDYLLDAYSGYHQIALNPNDGLKTLFITPFDAYCYITMPFRPKNIGANYQCTMQRYLHTQLGCNIETYVDNVVNKSQVKEDRSLT